MFLAKIAIASYISCFVLITNISIKINEDKIINIGFKNSDTKNIIASLLLLTAVICTILNIFF